MDFENKFLRRNKKAVIQTEDYLRCDFSCYLNIYLRLAFYGIVIACRLYVGNCRRVSDAVVILYT